jgi:hypothetical protein
MILFFLCHAHSAGLSGKLDRFAVLVPGVPKALLFDGKRQCDTFIQRWIESLI